MEQLSVYVENKKGTIKSILSVLSNANINVLGFVNDYGGEFGTIRLIISDTKKAQTLLEKDKFLCKIVKVIGIELDDTPGSLEKLMTKIQKMNINIDYIYVGYRRENNMPIIVIHTDEQEIVENELLKTGYKIY